jgi:histidinol-phosphate phosphatase family protein
MTGPGPNTGEHPSGHTPPEQRAHRVSLVMSGDHGPVLRETRPAIFLDRDGTLIRDVGYISRAEDVRLVPGAAGALRTAHRRQRPIIVVTNQSGIARGLLTHDDYAAVRRRMDELLAEQSAYVDAEYACPHHPDFTGPCDCRKPALGLFERAIREHGLDPAASAFIGDRWRDVAPALHYGGRGILVPTDATPAEEIARARAEIEVLDTLQAAIEAAVSHG